MGDGGVNDNIARFSLDWLIASPTLRSEIVGDIGEVPCGRYM